MLHGRTLPYIFNMVSEEMCVLIRLPDLLNSLRLCLQLMLCNKGKQNRASFPVECFLLPPRGKSNSHRLNKETLQGTSITTFVFGALFRQGGAKSGHKGETMHSLGTMEMIALSTHAATANRTGKNIPPPLHSVNKG